MHTLVALARRPKLGAQLSGFPLRCGRGCAAAAKSHTAAGRIRPSAIWPTLFHPTWWQRQTSLTLGLTERNGNLAEDVAHDVRHLLLSEVPAPGVLVTSIRSQRHKHLLQGDFEVVQLSLIHI